MSYEIPFASQGVSFSFMERARHYVYEIIQKRLEGSGVAFEARNVSAYWFSKDSKGWVVLLNTNLPDNIYYRVTHDSVRGETSVDTFHKFDSQTFKDKEPY